MTGARQPAASPRSGSHPGSSPLAEQVPRSVSLPGACRAHRPQDRSHEYWLETKTVGLEFAGTPGSIVLAGRPAYLTRVSFDLATRLDYMINVNAVDYDVFSDCYTRAGYALSLGFGHGGFLFPDQDRILYSAFDASIKISSWSMLSRSWANYHKEVHTQVGRSFSRSADDYDLSFLDVDTFTVELQRGLLLLLYDWDTNDSINHIALSDYKWEGDLTISYEYEYGPVPPAVPIPSAVFLLWSCGTCRVQANMYRAQVKGSGAFCGPISLPRCKPNGALRQKEPDPLKTLAYNVMYG